MGGIVHCGSVAALRLPFSTLSAKSEDRFAALRDEIAFGLEAGGELKIETTICNEIREHRQAVVIDDVAADPLFPPTTR